MLAWVIGGLLAASAAAGFAVTAFTGHAPTPTQSGAAVQTYSPTPSAPAARTIRPVCLAVRLPERVPHRGPIVVRTSAGQCVSIPIRAHIPVAQRARVAEHIRILVRVSLSVRVGLSVRVRVGVRVSIYVGTRVDIGTRAFVTAYVRVGQHNPARIGIRGVVGHQELSGHSPPDQEMYLDTGSRPLSI